MVERPIILFGTPTTSRKSNRRGGSSKIQHPTHSRQLERLNPKMESLQNALIALQQSPTGIETERTLVLEVAGNEANISLCPALVQYRKWKKAFA